MMAMKPMYPAILFTVLFALAFFSGKGQSGAERQGRPNIIFILTDDQRWDAAGYAGNKIILTPEMNRLAAEGADFTNAFVTTPICAASRASFLTGLYERTHRFTFQVDKISDEHMELSYPKIMKDNGYHTGFFGKLGVSFDGTDDLFNVYEFYDRNTKFDDRRGYFYKTLHDDTVHLTTYTGAQAREFIDSAPEDKPFCLSLSFSAPHAHDPAPLQYFWVPEVDDLYSNISIPEADISEDKYFEALPSIVKQGFNRTRWEWRFDTPEKYQHSVKGYFRMISGVDRELGKIRELLKDKGLDRNTVIILMGDNGYFLGERQLAGKWLLYENSIRVPLIVYDPRGRSGIRITQSALNIDVPATMLGYAGIPLPQGWQGKSLVPLVNGEAISLQRDTVLFEHLWEMPNIPPSEGVRTEEWKYFRYINDHSIEELYNLKDDPKEINNLAGNRRYRKVLMSLRKKCDELLRKYQDPRLGAPVKLHASVREVPGKKVMSAVYGWELPAAISAQKGYQILVASSDEKIQQNIGDVWDSRQVKDAQHADILHGGEPLTPGRSYAWKVRIWDQDNRLTEFTSPAPIAAGKR